MHIDIPGVWKVELYIAQSIVVTGSHKKRIKSDLMIWEMAVTAEAPKLPQAYERLTGKKLPAG